MSAVAGEARTGGAGTGRRTHEAFDQVFGTAYVTLMTNVLLAVACLPLVVVVFATDLTTSWPLLALLAPLCAPALVGAFAVFAAFSTQGTTTVVRTFARAWRHGLRRSLTVGVLAVAVVVVLGVDTRLVWGSRVGAVAIPFFVTLGVLALATATLALVALGERTDLRVRDLLRAGLYLAVRRWYLSGASLLVLGLLVTMIGARPVLGLGLAAAPLLYAVWANGRYAMRPVLAPGTRTPAAHTVPA
jgi:uncharacterized membrane protein YesL